MALVRRLLVVCAMGLWLGGLTLYSVVVVRNSHKVFVSHYKVGLVTQRVTEELNLIGGAALALMLWNWMSAWRLVGRKLRIGMTAALGVTLAAHAAVFVLHRFMDGLLDGGASMASSETFHRPHEHYLIATTVEWVAGLVYLLAALAGWRAEDRATSDRRAAAPPAPTS